MGLRRRSDTVRGTIQCGLLSEIKGEGNPFSWEDEPRRHLRRLPCGFNPLIQFFERKLSFRISSLRRCAAPWLRLPFSPDERVARCTFTVSLLGPDSLQPNYFGFETTEYTRTIKTGSTGRLFSISANPALWVAGVPEAVSHPGRESRAHTQFGDACL